MAKRQRESALHGDRALHSSEQSILLMTIQPHDPQPRKREFNHHGLSPTAENRGRPKPKGDAIMLIRRIAVYSSIAALTLGLAAGNASAAISYSAYGHWPPDWPKELDAWRGSATTFSYAPSNEAGFYTVSFKDHKAFENGWPALLTVERKADAALILVSEPLHDEVHKRMKRKPRGTPTVQITAHWRLDGDGKIRQGQVIHRIRLFVDGKVVDLNRIRIPDGLRIEDRRNLPVHKEEEERKGEEKK